MHEEEGCDYHNYWEEGQLKKENKDLYVLDHFIMPVLLNS